MVTLESVAGRLKGAKHVVVAAGAVVTPSVRDELSRRGIELVERRAAKKTSTLAPLLLVAGRTGHDPETAVLALRQAGIDVHTESTPCLIEATEKLAAAVATGALGVLWTRRTSVGLCLANRHKRVRAVLASNVAATSASVAAVGANVLVVDPTAGTMYERKQALHEFCLGGIRECPEELKKVPEYVVPEYRVRPMRIADVIGTVTLNRTHPSVVGATWKLVVPLSWDNLLGKSAAPVEEVVVFDELGAGLGSRIALSEGREAAMPFYPEVKPIDACNAAILDTFTVDIPEDLK